MRQQDGKCVVDIGKGQPHRIVTVDQELRHRVARIALYLSSG
jgi:hypothetical protein